jgi:hypothetical protein
MLADGTTVEHVAPGEPGTKRIDPMLCYGLRTATVGLRHEAIRPLRFRYPPGAASSEYLMVL